MASPGGARSWVRGLVRGRPRRTTSRLSRRPGSHPSVAGSPPSGPAPADSVLEAVAAVAIGRHRGGDVVVEELQRLLIGRPHLPEPERGRGTHLLERLQTFTLGLRTVDEGERLGE